MWSLGEGFVYKAIHLQEIGDCDTRAMCAGEPRGQELCGLPTQTATYPGAGFSVLFSFHSPQVIRRKLVDVWFLRKAWGEGSLPCAWGMCFSF